MYCIGKFAAPGAVIALSVLVVPAFAQNGSVNNPAPSRYSGNMDANGFPTDHSTPAERAKTRALNQAIVSANRAADAKATAQHQQYESKRAEYAEQQARYHDAVNRHAPQRDAYKASRNAYGLARARYNAALVHHRHDWPDSNKWMMVVAAPDPVGMTVRFLDGTVAGTIRDVAHGMGGQVEALLLQMNDDQKAWIKNTDVRFDKAGGRAGVLMTDLDARDIRAMAGQGAAAVAQSKAR